MNQLPVPVGFAIPQVFIEGPVDMSLVSGFVKHAESLGVHSLWVQEQILGPAPFLEPLSLLNYVAGVTKEVKLGTAVVILSTRNPVLLAKELSTLDQMSGGRLIVGLALGGRPSMYPLLGGPSERRVRHFVECLEVMKALWTQKRASYHGHFWRLNGEAMEPKPVQRPHPPIWFGGRHFDGLKRAVRYGDGWMGAGSTSTVQFRDHVGTIRGALEDARRDVSTFPISKRVYVAVDEDEKRAERRLRAWSGARYGDPDLASRVSVWGSASRCIDGLAAVLEAGAQMLMLDPVLDPINNLEALHRGVLAHLYSPN